MENRKENNNENELLHGADENQKGKLCMIFLVT